MDREKLFRYLDERYSSKRDMISRIPLGVQPDTLWQELLNRRRTHSTVLPLLNSNGMPYWYVTTNKMVTASEKIVDALFENETEHDPYAQAPPVSTLEEVFYTSYVEGAQITMQAAMDYLTSDQPPRDIEEQIIANNRMAGSYAADNLYRPVDIDMLRDLAYILTDGMDNGGGDFRAYEGTDYYSDNGEEFRFPPPGSVPDLIQSLCLFLSDAKTHPLIKAAIAQAYILVVRPFPEGNERLGRILSNMILLRSGYTFFSDISLSALIARRSYAYYEATANILREDSGGDLTYFVEYFMELLSRAVDERQLRIQRSAEQTRIAEMEMARTPLNPSLPIAPENATPERKTEEEPEGFYPVSEFDPAVASDEGSDPDVSLGRVRDQLYDLMDSKGLIMKKCAEILIGIMDEGNTAFTVEDIRTGCDVSMKQASNLVTHLKLKGLIESYEDRYQGRYMLYRFGTRLSPLHPDDYSPDIISAIERMKKSPRSEKDRRIGELIYSCLPKGLILISDYEQVNIIERIHYDMALPIQMGLIDRIDRGVYRINRKINADNVRLTDSNKQTITDIYNTFGCEWFTRKGAMTVINLARSAVYNILHKFAAQGLLECRKGDSNQYRLLVNPKDHSSFFADSTLEDQSGAPDNSSESELPDDFSLSYPEQYEDRIYNQEVYDLIDTLAASETSSKDKRLAEVLRRCIKRGTILRSDYDEWGYTENMWLADTKLAKQLGLVTKRTPECYSLNTELNPELLPNQKKTISAIYEAFGYDEFSSEMFVATLNYSISYTYASLHKLTLLRILDQNIDEDGSRYRLMVNPEDHPECFETAA